MIADLFTQFFGNDPIIQSLVGGIVIALLNLLGAALVIVWRDPSQRVLNTSLGFAAGVMLAASFTSLIVPGVEVYSDGNPLPVLTGVAVGALFLDRADILLPHVHFLLTGRQRPDAANQPTEEIISNERLAPVLLFILAITLHNMPEGLAVGVAFGSGSINDAVALMVAIGIQNIPEGLAVSVSAINAGLDRRWYAALVGVRAGLVEIPLAVLGAFAVTLISALLPYAMGFAAGAMLFVISDEIIPETHADGYERIATLGTILGIIVMLYLDISLG